MRRLNSLAGRLAIWLAGLVLILPGIALAAEAAQHEEPGIINLNVTILIQAINFLILIFLLSKFLFKPLDEIPGGPIRRHREVPGRGQGSPRGRGQGPGGVPGADAGSPAGDRGHPRAGPARGGGRAAAAAPGVARRRPSGWWRNAKAEIEAETKRAKAGLREEAAGIALAAAERLLGRTIERGRPEAAGRPVRA